MSKTAYIIFSKIPEPGYVKTRLASDLTPTSAAQIQTMMLQKLFKLSQTLTSEMTIFFAYQGRDPQTTATFLAQRPSWLQAFPQATGTLGFKMTQAIEKVQQQGFERVLLTGSDIPQLTAATLRRAAAVLATHDLVLGPTFDGGYYLIGTHQTAVAPFLDTDISWSSNSVWETTVALIQRAHCSLALLPTLVDVDFKADLQKVAAYIEG